METRDRRNDVKPKILKVILITLLVALLGLNGYAFKVLFDHYNTYNTVKNDLLSKNDYYQELNDKEQYLNSEIERINNLPVAIEEARVEYHKTLKIFEDKVINKEVDKKIAYVTFDDGPYYKTDQFLAILKEKNVRATFFTMGADKDYCYDNRAESCKETYYKEYIAGHTLGNHTYSHAIHYGLYTSVNSFIEQVKMQQEKINNLTGYTTNIVRFPGGSNTAGVLKQGIIKKLSEMNYGYVDWTAADGDGGNLSDATTAWTNLRNSIGDDIEVVLFHDYNRITLSILPDVIDYLRENNYVLLPLFYESTMVNKG